MPRQWPLAWALLPLEVLPLPFFFLNEYSLLFCPFFTQFTISLMPPSFYCQVPFLFKVFVFPCMKVVVGSVYVSERVVQSKLGSFYFFPPVHPCARGQVRSHHRRNEQPLATGHCTFTCDKLDDLFPLVRRNLAQKKYPVFYTKIMINVLLKHLWMSTGKSTWPQQPIKSNLAVWEQVV